MMIAEHERPYLERCIELAKEALDAGDQPFGSVLVSAEGTILAEDRNRIADGDNTQHPEFALARWAANNLSEHDRQHATVYTSGDRKSTRLNSSHVRISYAVFCLKKKTKIEK